MRDKAAISKAAQKFLAKGQIDLAIAEWEKLADGSTDGNILNTIGDLYLKKGAREDSISYFGRAADLFRKDGFNLKAMALYKKILNIFPSDMDSLFALAELNEEKGLLSNANEYYLAAADIYSEENAVEKALDIYQKVLALSPENENLRQRIAGLYLKVGLTGEAVNQYVELAMAYTERGELEKAKKFYEKVIDIVPRNVPTFTGLSRIAVKENNFELAEEYIEQALSFEPDNKEALMQRVELYLGSGMVDDARSVLTKILAAHPDHPLASRHLGEICLKENDLQKAWEVLVPYIDNAVTTGNWTDALRYLDRLREIEPVAVQVRLARISRNRGDKEGAVRELVKLASLYDERGQHSDALQSYREILELKPGDEKAEAMVRTLEERMGISSEAPEKQPDAGDIPVTSPDEEVTADSGEPVSMSAGEFEEKKKEADFYFEYGFKDQAKQLFERLHAASPGNSEIEEKLNSLRTSVGDVETDEKVETSGEEEGAGEGDYRDSRVLTDGDVKDLFNEFKKGLEKEVDEKDSETHYNLGIAYKEMGLVDDAIRELQIASKDPGRRLASLSVIALCYMSKGHYQEAVAEYKRALTLMAPSDENYLEFSFDLAGAYLQNKDYDNALKVFVKIHRQSPDFKNVSQEIETVKEIISKTKDGQKKDRVSYI
jgi:tetratricopeptide (TPR) repeat protein